MSKTTILIDEFDDYDKQCTYSQEGCPLDKHGTHRVCVEYTLISTGINSAGAGGGSIHGTHPIFFDNAEERDKKTHCVVIGKSEYGFLSSLEADANGVKHYNEFEREKYFYENRDLDIYEIMDPTDATGKFEFHHTNDEVVAWKNRKVEVRYEDRPGVPAGLIVLILFILMIVPVSCWFGYKK